MIFTKNGRNYVRLPNGSEYPIQTISSVSTMEEAMAYAYAGAYASQKTCPSVYNAYMSAYNTAKNQVDILNSLQQSSTYLPDYLFNEAQQSIPLSSIIDVIKKANNSCDATKKKTTTTTIPAAITTTTTPVATTETSIISTSEESSIPWWVWGIGLGSIVLFFTKKSKKKKTKK